MPYCRHVISLFLVLVGCSCSFGDDRVPIAVVSASATSTFNNQLPEFSIDGVTSNSSRWLADNINSQHRLTLELGQNRSLQFIKVAMGWSNSVGVWTSPISNFHFEYRDGNKTWLDIPGSFIGDNRRSVVTISLTSPISTDAVRLVSDDDGYVRVAEVYLFDDSPGELPIVELERPEILVNQSGYNAEGVKRFTAPGRSLTPFEIVRASDQSVVWSGDIIDGVGDFSEFSPKTEGEEYFVRVSGLLRSDRFQVEPYWMERVCFEPAFKFFVDCRSVIGDIPNAYGADPYRDGAYYCYDVQSLILNYLANPSFYNQMPIEIDYDAQRAMVLDPSFQLVTNQNAEDSIEVARTYYNDFDPPVGENVPDIIHCIHWTMAFLQTKTQDWDYAGDPAGRQLHTQHVEKFAYFLYAFPYYKQYFTQQYYDDALQFAIDNWNGEGGNLFGVIQTDILDNDVVTATFKGRNCPGHSILPNLMMYEVALREGLPNAEQYFTAAFNQTLYIIANFSPDNVRLTKGQRMSEHMLPTGLFAMMRMYPDRAPSDLQQWIDDWVNVMISRSDNAYDFRRFGVFEGEDLWTIPRFGDESSNGGSGWNEPGNVACVPGILTALGSQATDQTLRPRLEEISAAHFDALFGRNPTGWHSSFNGTTDFVGVERGWQKDFNPNAGARLHGVRGTLNSVATHEHYPNQFDSGFLRHAEGWVAFNAAFNVSLAMRSWDRTSLEFEQTSNSINITLKAPVFRSSALVRVTTNSGDVEEVSLSSTNDLQTVFAGNLVTDSQGSVIENDGVLIYSGGGITAEYGGGFFGRRAVGSLAPTSVVVQTGVPISSDATDLVSSDGQTVEIQGEIDNEIGGSVVLETTTTVPENVISPQIIELFVDSATNTPGIEVNFQLFNHTSNQYESIGQSEEFLMLQSTHEIQVNEFADSYIDNDNQIKSRIIWKPHGPVLFYPWTIDVDSYLIQIRD